LPLKFNTSTNTELMKPIPGTLQEGAPHFRLWLAAGANPGKTLRLARMNLEVRNTPRARRLLARAVDAKESFVDSSEHADRDFVFTRGREMDSNETAAAEEFTK
jgi:hypothetical protein